MKKVVIGLTCIVLGISDICQPFYDTFFNKTDKPVRIYRGYHSKLCRDVNWDVLKPGEKRTDNIGACSGTHFSVRYYEGKPENWEREKYIEAPAYNSSNTGDAVFIIEWPGSPAPTPMNLPPPILDVLRTQGAATVIYPTVDQLRPYAQNFKIKTSLAGLFDPLSDIYQQTIGKGVKAAQQGINKIDQEYNNLMAKIAQGGADVFTKMIHYAKLLRKGADQLEKTPEQLDSAFTRLEQTLPKLRKGSTTVQAALTKAQNALQQIKDQRTSIQAKNLPDMGLQETHDHIMEALNKAEIGLTTLIQDILKNLEQTTNSNTQFMESQITLLKNQINTAKERIRSTDVINRMRSLANKLNPF